MTIARRTPDGRREVLTLIQAVLLACHEARKDWREVVTALSSRRRVRTYVATYRRTND